MLQPQKESLDTRERFKLRNALSKLGLNFDNYTNEKLDEWWFNIIQDDEAWKKLSNLPLEAYRRKKKIEEDRKVNEK